MADQDLDARLKQLQAILDERVTLLTKPPKPRGRRGRPDSATNSTGQRGMHAPSASSPAPILPSSLLVNQPGSMRKTQQPNRAAASGLLVGAMGADLEVLQKSEFRKGQSFQKDIAFCPWKTVLSYPGQYIGKANRPRARVYFDSIYEGRSWDFFYLHNPAKPKNEPFLLVPTCQFTAFLEYINDCLGTALVIPRGMEFKFCIKIQGPGMPKPRYLTRSNDQRTFTVQTFPEISPDDVEAYESMQPVEQGHIQKALQVFSSRDPDKVRKDQRRQKQDAGMLLDAQRMLGIKTSLVPLDVVFVCIDAEALERKPNPVSEVGIAILDTRDLKGVKGGPAGRDWWSLIKAYHLRIKEYSGLRNFQFVQGCPDQFSFGTSTFPPAHQVADEIMGILKPWTANDRDLVLVGHDVSQDIKYLRDLGIDTQDISFIRDIDSQVIHKSWRQLRDGRGLEAVLSELCMQFKFLHNAGNDAVYTLRAVIGVAVEQAREEELAAKGEKYVPALFEA